MDLRRISTAESRLTNRYEIIEDHRSHLLVLQKLSNQRKLLYRIDLTDVKSEERKWAVIDYINEYKGLHLLPCMVKLGESFRDTNSFYVMQEVIKYGTLRDEWLASCRSKVPLEEESIKLWMCQILLALNALHMRKIVHGAVTIDNVFITGKNDNVRLGPTNEFLQLHNDPSNVTHQISSFKTAKANETHDVTEKFKTAKDSMECLEHLAPEMFNASGDVDYSNDIWALGILGYKLAIQQAPFEGNTPVHIVMSIQRSEPDWELVLNRGYSEEFVKVLKEMLVKDPNNRGTCRHLLNMEYFPAEMNFG